MLWKVLQKSCSISSTAVLGEENRLTESSPVGGSRPSTWWGGVQLGLLIRDLSFLPSSSHSVKLSPQSTAQAQDDEESRRTVTVNPAHMGKAFKVMNELRRYFPTLPVPFQMEPEG